MLPDTAPTLPAPPPFLEHSTPECRLWVSGSAVVVETPAGKRVHQWQSASTADHHAQLLGETLLDLGYAVTIGK